MSTLEQVVRPFQTTLISPAQTAPVAQVTRLKNVVLNVGASGAVKTMSGAYSMTQTYYNINKPKEKTTT